MATTSSIPVTIRPEAAAHVAELGMQREFEQMLEFIQQFEGLHAIDVTLAEPPDYVDDPRVLFETDLRLPRPALPSYISLENQWTSWRFSTFSADVIRHFTLMLFDGSPHEG